MNLTQPSDESSDAAQMKIISSANGIIASSILGNEKGCYEVFDRPANGDLMMVAAAWFGTRLGKQKSTFKMQNDLGEVYDLRLPSSVATGAW